MLCFPRGDARAKRLSLYAGFSHSAANTRLRQATKAAHRTDSDFPATAMLSKGIQLGTNGTSPLLPQKGFGCSLCRLREEEPRESWCLLGLAFPGSKFTPWIHRARPNSADTVTTLQQCVCLSMALYADYYLLGYVRLGLLLWHSGRLGL